MKHRYIDYYIEPYLTGYTYKIHVNAYYPYDERIIEAYDWFDSEEDAIESAKLHIELLQDFPE